MILEKKLMPDMMLRSFSDLTPRMLSEMGVGGLICDIDNTLATYDDLDMPAAVRRWIGEMRDGGIGVAFVSNNNAERVDRFIGDSAVPGFPDAKKPSPDKFKEAANIIADGRPCAVLGDQLLTDALAAHRAGMIAITVPPIKDRTGLFFRFKRWLEKPYVRKFVKNHPNTRISAPEWGI